MRTESASGLTVLEVVIAIAVLAMGILAAVTFQASTLHTNRDAQVINQLTRLASTEMELRRQTLVENTGTFPCITAVPAGLAQEDCTVEIVPCGIIIAENASEFACGAGLNFATYRLTVTAQGQGHSVELRSLFGGFYVSGQLSSE